MKPERINFADMIRGLIWGIFQTLQFDTAEQAENFIHFVFDMAGNHGRNVDYHLDPSHTRVVFLVEANSNGQLVDNQKFIAQVLDIYDAWKSPDEEPAAVTAVPAGQLN